MLAYLIEAQQLVPVSRIILQVVRFTMHLQHDRNSFDHIALPQ